MRGRSYWGQWFSSRKHRKSSSQRIKKPLLAAIESLEARCVLSATVTSNYLTLSYPSAPQAGASVTVNAKINGTLISGVPRTGTLSVSEGTDPALATLDLSAATPNSSGYYALVIPAGLTAGSHVLSIAYSGDDNYAATSSNVTLSVVNDTLALKYTSQTLPAAQYSVGVAVKSTQLTGTPGGTLTLSEGSNTLATVNLTDATPDANGYFTLAAGNLSVGNHTLRISYSGDGTYTANSASISVKASVPLSTTVGASYSSSPFTGAAYTVNAIVNGIVAQGVARTGTLSLVEGEDTVASVDLATATPNANGYYGLTVANGLAVGTHNFQVVYSGDANYGGSKLTLATVTSKLQTTSVASSYSTTGYVGGAFTVTSKVNGSLTAGVDRTGTLSLVEGDTTLASVNLATAVPNTAGYFSLTVAGGLSLGTHALQVVYSGDALYATSKQVLSTVTSKQQTTSLITSYTTVPYVGSAYTVGAQISGILTTGAARTGTLSLVEGDATLASLNLATAVPGSNGYYSLTVAAGLTVGTHALKVVYSGDAGYVGSSATLSTVTAKQYATTTSVGYSTSVYVGSDYVVTAKVNGTLSPSVGRTGTISLVEGDTTLASVNVATATPDAAGNYAVTVAGGLSLGTHALKVVYSGDVIYTSSSYTLPSVTARQYVTSILPGSYSTIPYVGTDFTVTAKVSGTAAATGRTGTLSLVEGSTTLASVDIATATPDANGYVTLKVAGGLTAGAHALKVVYSGDTLYAGSNYPLMTVTSRLYTSSISPSYSISPNVGYDYTVGAKLTSSPAPATARTGTLTLVEGDTILASVNLATATPNATGYYSLTVAGGLSLGAHSVKIVYSGDSLYAATSYSLATINVRQIGSSIALSYTTPQANQSLTVNAKVNGSTLTDPPRTGTLTLSEGDNVLATADITTATPNANGYFALTVAGGLGIGTHTLKITYSGDTTYASATSSLTTTLINDSLAVKRSALTLIGAQYPVGIAVRTTQQLGSAPGGTLTISEGGVTLATLDLGDATPDSAGYYTLNPGSFTAGAHTLKVTYSGDGVYSANSTSFSFTAVSPLTTTVVASGAATSTINNAYTVSALISGTVAEGVARTGTLALVEGDTTLASVDISAVAPGSNGYYSLTVTGGVLSLGSHTLQVVYTSGDANYSGSSKTLSAVNVVKVADSLSVSYPTSTQAGTAVTISTRINGTVQTANPRTGTITVSDGDNVLGTIDLSTATPTSTGYYALSLPAGLTAGGHAISVSYSGDDVYAAATSNVSINVLNDTLALKYTSQALVGAKYVVGVAVKSTQLTGTPGGTITLTEGSTVLATLDLSDPDVAPDANGYYSLSVDAGFALGVHSLKVNYSGDGTWTANSSALTVTGASPLATSLGLSYSSGLNVTGTFYAYVSIGGSTALGIARTGTITITEGDNVLKTIDLATAVPNASGQYYLSLAAGTLPAGTHSLSIAYSGDDNYAAATRTISVSVYNDYLLTKYSTTATTGSDYTVQVAVRSTTLTTPPTGGTLSLVQGSTVLGYIDLSSEDVVADAQGYYTIKLTGGFAAAGNVTGLRIVYSGDAVYTGYTVSLATVKVTDPPAPPVLV
jgi:hypothetical protein